MADYLDYIEAHKYCRNHWQEVLGSKVCDCSYCQQMFHPDKINANLKDIQNKRHKTTHDRYNINYYT